MLGLISVVGIFVYDGQGDSCIIRKDFCIINA